MRLRWTVRIGSIAGIEIGVHPSWLIVYALFAYSAFEGSSLLDFPLSHAQRVALGLTVSLLLFASVVVHEFAHAFVARRQGIPIGNITLFLFGGVATILREPGSPSDEVWMAGAGPLASFCLSALFGLFWLVFRALRFEWGWALAEFLTLGNALLGLFNLLPAFPSDGGRIVRAALWRTLKSQARATGFAALISSVVASLLILAGIAFAILSYHSDPNWSFALWPVVIGGFLFQASLVSARQARINLALERMSVTECLSPKLISVPAETSVSAFVSSIVVGDPSAAYAVVDDGRFIGLIAVRDTGAVPHNLWDVTPVRAVMTPAHRMPSINADAAACDALSQLELHTVRELPVFEGGSLMGTVTHDTIFAALAKKGTAQP
jgi:Zn-dependent protease